MRSSRSSVIQDCELLAEGEDLKVQGCPALNRSSQGMEQGNEDGSHAGHATLECPRRSTISRPTGFSVATTCTRPRYTVDWQSGGDQFLQHADMGYSRCPAAAQGDADLDG